MPLIAPFSPRPPDAPTAPAARDDVTPIGALRDLTKDRTARDRRERRRQLLRHLHEEAEAVNVLSPDDREAVRRNFLEHLRIHLRRRTAAQEPPSSPEQLIPLALPPDDSAVGQQAEKQRLAAELRRCIAFHTERADKIAHYVHALQAAEETHHAIDMNA